MDTYTRPDPEQAALLTIDTQNDFTLPGAPAEIEGTVDAVPRMARLAGAFRSAEAPIVHVVRLYEADGSNVDRCRRAAIEEGAEIVRPGTDGAELVEKLKPSEDVGLEADRLLDGEFQQLGSREWLLYKPRWSASSGPSLNRSMSIGIRTGVIDCNRCNFR